MNDPQTLLRKDAADLHRFLQPMAEMCAVDRRDHPYYSDASYSFFDHIHGLIADTLKYLEGLSQRPSKFREVQHSLRQRLKLLRDSWGLLHRYIKPSLDSDALHIPFPLLNVLNDKLQRVPGCNDFECAVFQLTAVNYVMLPYNEVNRVADRIAGIVKGKPFLQNLTLVGIPYSQSSGLFLNCLIPHEMAHFVYQELMGDEVRAKVDSILNSHYADVQNATEEAVSQVRDLLNQWVEEIYCDFFAISIVGPAFTFAFAEMTSASLIIDECDGKLAQSFEFGLSHPADVARFHLHMKYLQALGWWDPIQSWKSNSVELLKQCGRVSEKTSASSTIPPDVRKLLDLRCFWEVSEWLLDFVKTKVPTSGEDIDDLADYYGEISKYLAHAIIPSTIVTKSGPVYPNPVVIINSAFRFVLEDLDRLLENIEDVVTDSVSDRSKYTERLEIWILKALEDYRLLSASQEAK